MRCKAPVKDPKWRAPEEKRTRQCLNSAVTGTVYCRTHLKKHTNDSLIEYQEDLKSKQRDLDFEKMRELGFGIYSFNIPREVFIAEDSDPIWAAGWAYVRIDVLESMRRNWFNSGRIVYEESVQDANYKPKRVYKPATYEKEDWVKSSQDF